jgi:hypothetical protein
MENGFREDIIIQAEKFKALRLEYKRVKSGASGWSALGGKMTN